MMLSNMLYDSARDTLKQNLIKKRSANSILIFLLKVTLHQ